MQPHEQRVVDEKKELDDRLDKLTAFIDKSPVFDGLPSEDQSLLRHQRRVMVDYSHILDQRIARFAQ